ncbi:MAG: DUF3445 domain-containing protein, partial [Burkholderiales bacterium]
MQIPFPVEVPYRVRPDLRRLSGPYCVTDANRHAYLAAKRDAIERAQPAPLCFACDDLPGLAAALRASAALLGVTVAGGADRAALPADSAATLEAEAHALALAMQEDYVLLRAGPGGVVAELLHVCFPSGWAPRGKLGLSLAEV